MDDIIPVKQVCNVENDIDYVNISKDNVKPYYLRHTRNVRPLNFEVVENFEVFRVCLNVYPVNFDIHNVTDVFYWYILNADIYVYH